MPEIDAIDNAQPIGFSDVQLRRTGTKAMSCTDGAGGEAQFSAKQLTANNDFQVGGILDARTAGNGRIRTSAEFVYQWSDASGAVGNTVDLQLARGAAGLLDLFNLSGNTGAAMQFTEMTAPSAGASNTARLFCRDNGSGKTQLCAIFPTGAIQVIATEP